MMLMSVNVLLDKSKFTIKKNTKYLSFGVNGNDHDEHRCRAG